MNLTILQWKLVNGATEYRVYRLDPETQSLTPVQTATQLPCVINALTPETDYQFVIESAAVTAGGTLVGERSAPVSVRTAAVKLQPGDVDGNGEIEVTDARYALRAAVGLENYEPGMREFLAADTDENGEIEVSDARNILRAAVGLDKPEDWKTA